ncbi:NAD(P)-dependent oxidoreductase [Pseudochelatococcus sp. B33]
MTFVPLGALGEEYRRISMTSEVMIGFAGLGAMGFPITENIVKAGHRIAVYDIDEKRSGSFEARARICDSPKDLAETADIVFLCLPTLQSHWDILNGPLGLLQGSRMGICVITGTVGPSFAREIEQALAAKGVLTVDAPMTGGRLRAASGTLTIMLSGPPEAIAKVEPVISAYGNKIVPFGDSVGQAQTMKLINNIMSAANLTIAAEALVFGGKAGLDPEQVLEVVNSGTGRNELTHTVVPQNVLTRNFDFGSSIATVKKDMTAAIDEADRLGTPVEMTRLIRDLFEKVGRELDENADQTQLVRYFENLAGIELPKTR